MDAEHNITLNTTESEENESDNSEYECEYESEPEPESESMLAKYLSNAYEVLRKIFSYLPLEDIERAGEAFESWKPIAQLTRRERRCIETFIVSDQKYKMSEIWGEADYCISFSTACNKDVEKQITKYMTHTGQFCQCLTGAGIIGTVSDLSQLVQQKVRVGLSSAQRKYYFSVLRIPSFPKVGIKTYLWKEGMDFSAFKTNFDIPTSETIKCVLILMITEGSVEKANLQKNDFIHFLQTRQKEGFAIGGSVIDSFGTHSYGTTAISMTKYVIFYGDNVEAASTVLTADIKTMMAINSKVAMLKDMCPPMKMGALMVFRCAGRQRVIRSKLASTNISKWEGDAIQRYFPSLPVVGCFGYGEFGREFPTAEEEVLPLERLRLFNWEFSFSTSIVYLGFMK